MTVARMPTASSDGRSGGASGSQRERPRHHDEEDQMARHHDGEGPLPHRHGKQGMGDRNRTRGHDIDRQQHDGPPTYSMSGATDRSVSGSSSLPGGWSEGD